MASNTEAEDNFVCSALRAHVVLSMTAYGAEGKTEQEMQQALQLPGDDTATHEGFQNFIDILDVSQYTLSQ